MTINEWLQKNSSTLSKAGVQTARLDSVVLLEDALGQNRANLLAHPDQEISPKTEVKLNKKIAQRCQHTPLAYIRGMVEFYGREFAVNSHVMVPRPETESIIEELKDLKMPAKPIILDVGTGTGCIAITAALEISHAKVIATDISKDALKLAKQNAINFHAKKVQLLNGDLLKPLETTRPKLTAIVANLPYVPESYPINKAAEFEPKIALFAGKDGLDLYRRFWAQVSELPHKPKYIITESLIFQHEANARLACAANFSLEKTSGLVQLFSLA